MRGRKTCISSFLCQDCVQYPITLYVHDSMPLLDHITYDSYMREKDHPILSVMTGMCFTTPRKALSAQYCNRFIHQGRVIRDSTFEF